MRKLIIGGTIALILVLSANVYSRQSEGNSFEQEFLDRINQVRQQGCNCGNTFMPPTPPLTWNKVLAKAAFEHAKDMSKHNYFSHTSPDGRTPDQRTVAAGYDYKGFKSFETGENIAMGQQSIPEVMDGWIKSEGHCKNLMNPGFKEVGVAQYNDYWVQEFGGRVPFSVEQQKLIKSGKIKLIERPVQ